VLRSRGSKVEKAEFGGSGGLRVFCVFCLSVLYARARGAAAEAQKTQNIILYWQKAREEKIESTFHFSHTASLHADALTYKIAIRRNK
jgi:hypothetical protein